MNVTGIGQNYYQNNVAAMKSIKSVNGMEETGSTQELSEAEKLESFKKEMWKEINSLSWGSSISIQITDEVLKK